MNTKAKQSLLAVALGIFLAGCATTTKQTKWEYSTYDCPGLASTGDPNLGIKGAQGWELVGVSYDSNSQRSQYVFKRATR